MRRDGKSIATVGAGTTEYTDKDLWPATRYSYQVVALGGAGEENASNSIAVKTATPSLSDARLEGKFILDPVVRSSDLFNVHPGKPLRSFNVSFNPKCKSGACDGRFTHFYVSQNKQFHATNRGTYEQRQDSYLAELTNASMSWCDALGPAVLSTKDSAEYDIKVTEATVDKRGEWVATKIKGRDTEYYPFGSGCLAGHLTVDFEGRLGKS